VCPSCAPRAPAIAATTPRCWRGAGIAIEAKAITPAALTRLLTDERLRTAAQEVAAEIAAMPSPETLVPALEKLVGS
jgi:UDP:flavonoid glycosyltransferase YjiC (YdhE family)